MNALRIAILTLSFPCLLQAGGTEIDLAALPPSKDAKDSVILRPPATAPPRWSLGAGVLVRKVGEINFNTGVSPDMIPNLFGVHTFTEPPGIGPLGANADRTYDDGFVNIGAGTPGTGLTSFWGYNNGSQVQGGDLVYSRDGGERRDVTMSRTAAATSWSNDADWNAGPFLELSYSVAIQPKITAGVALNFSSVNIGGSRAGLDTISQFQQLDIYDVTAVDTFSLNGIVPPGAPFTGSLNGPNALIGNTPDSRAYLETLAGTSTSRFLDSVRDQLEVDLHTFGAGAVVNWTPRPQLLLSAQFGIVLNFADWRAQRDEVISQSNNGGPATGFSRRSVRSDELDILAGVYLQGDVAWVINEHWALQAFTRYDWNEELEGSVGPSSFTVDLSGWSIGAGARLSF